MADIEYIHNVCTGAVFNGVAPQWQFRLNGMPDYNPDECVIRSITYNNFEVLYEHDVFSIWCSLRNDMIGSISGGAINTTCPGTRIRLNSPVPNYLEFKFYRQASSTSPNPFELYNVQVNSSIVIHMDFIKYKRVALHA